MAQAKKQPAQQKVSKPTRSQRKRARAQLARSIGEGAEPARQAISRSAISGNTLARMIALPDEYATIRLPTVDMPRTSAISLKDVVTTSSPTTAINSSWSAGDLLVAYYGQAQRLCSFVASTGTYTYQLDFSSVSTMATQWDLAVGPVPASEAYGISALPWPLMSATNVSGPVHGVTMSVGQSRSGNYIFMNAGDTIATILATAWTSTAVGTVQFNSYSYRADGERIPYWEESITLVAGNIPAATVIMTAAAAGYYQIEFAGFSFSAGSITSTHNGVRLYLKSSAGTANRWVQKSMIDLDPGSNGDPNLGGKVRVNAASMLVSNTSAALYKQGTVVAARVRNVNFYDLTPSYMAPLAEKYTGPAEKGVYTFKEFTSYAEKFSEATVAKAGFYFDLDYDDFYHFIQLSNPNPATAANAYTISFSTAIEFQTDCARYAKGVSQFNFGHLTEARRVLNSNPHWFYENPSHMASIYNFLTRAVQGARTYGPKILDIAAMVDPQRALGYQAARTLLTWGQNAD